MLNSLTHVYFVPSHNVHEVDVGSESQWIANRTTTDRRQHSENSFVFQNHGVYLFLFIGKRSSQVPSYEQETERSVICHGSVIE